MHGEKDMEKKIRQRCLCRSALQGKELEKWWFDPGNLAVPIDKKTII